VLQQETLKEIEKQNEEIVKTRKINRNAILEIYSVPDTPGSLFIYKFTRIPQIRYVNILLQRENHSNSAVQNLYHTV
jgi:hypothetical protein